MLNMQDKILAALQTQAGAVTFPEVIETVGDEARGDHSLEVAPNVILWCDMSEEFTSAFLSLRTEGKLHFRCCRSTLDYLVVMSSGYYHLPIAKRPPKDGYKKLHWLPSYIVRGPMRGDEGR